MRCETQIRIKNKLGLHARAAAQFVKTANRYASEVKVAKNNHQVNGKSILGVLTLAAALGSTLHITCEGNDSEEALKALVSLIEEKFYEE